MIKKNKWIVDNYIFCNGKACILKCNEYIIINPSDPNNQKLIKLFEAKHLGHPVVSIPLSEVKDTCENIERELRKEAE